MSQFRDLLSGERAVIRQLLGAALVLTIVGIAIIAVGVFETWGPTRLFGAGLISLGGVLGGLAVGFSEPLRGKLGARLNSWRIRISVIIAIIVGGPALVATVSGVLGPLTGGGAANDTFLVVLGALFGLILAGATIAAGIIAVLAIHRRTGAISEPTLTPEERQA